MAPAPPGNPQPRVSCWQFLNQPFIAQLAAGAALLLLSGTFALCLHIASGLNDIPDLKRKIDDLTIEFKTTNDAVTKNQEKQGLALDKLEDRVLILENK